MSHARPPPPTDVCPNIDGNQAEVPDGMVKDEQGNCVTPPPPPTDVCPNIDGNQAEVPDGMVEDEQGNCVTPPPPPTDVCPNIDGNQATAPAGTVKDEHGNCVTPPPPPTGTTVTTDEFMDVQVIKDATPQVQLVNGQADIAYTIRVRNNGPNQAHNVVLMDAAPSGVTFLAVTLVGGNCTVTAALLNCTLGTIGPGVERTIELSARVTQTGTYVNSATGAGDGKDTNGANNTDDASTLVTAPVTPPTTTPKPPVAPKPSSRSRSEHLPGAQGDARDGAGEWQDADRARQGDALAEPRQRRRGQVLRQGHRQGRADERAGHRPSDDHAEQGGDHAREDHEREGVQQRPDRRDRRVRTAGDRLGTLRAALDPVPRLRRGAHRWLGEGSAGPQGPVGLCSGSLPGLGTRTSVDPPGGRSECSASAFGSRVVPPDARMHAPAPMLAGSTGTTTRRTDREGCGERAHGSRARGSMLAGTHKP